MDLNVGGVVSIGIGGSAISSGALKLQATNIINNLVPINKSGNDYIQFPNNLLSRSDITQYAYLKCKSKTQSGWSTNKKATHLGSVFLPLPRGISNSYKSNWGMVEGGLKAAAVAEVKKTAGADWENKLETALGGTGHAVGYAAKKAIHTTFEAAGAGDVYQNAMKEVMNPMNLLNWKAPDFRSFSFSWELVPSSAEEAESLNEIIYWMKRYIHSPSGPTESTLKYPPLWDIQFVDSRGGSGVGNKQANKFLFETKECAITDISIDYNAFGNAYHRGDENGIGYHAPNGIKLSISFTETRIITQTDYGDSYKHKSTP